MSSRLIILLFICVSMLIGCGNKLDPVSSDNDDENESVESSQGSQNTVANAIAENAENHEETDDYNFDKFVLLA